MATTVEKVREILDSTLDDANITAYITAAGLYLDTIFTGQDISEDLRNEIERWVTAHLISVSKERQWEEVDAGTASEKFTGKYEMGLSMTSYGQTAILLDTTGELQRSQKKKAQTTAVKSFDN